MPGKWIPDPLAPSGYRWQRAGEQPPTSMLPAVQPTEDTPGDVGDLIDPNADDPTPEEITHPDHSDYVEPWRPT